MTSDYESAFRIALARALAGFAITGWTQSQFNQLVRHYLMLRKWNTHINLTRIIEPDEAARLHYAESLYGARFVTDARSLLDVGSGAGFPAIPLAIFLPNVQVTALEVNQKKALFLNEVKDALALPTSKSPGPGSKNSIRVHTISSPAGRLTALRRCCPLLSNHSMQSRNSCSSAGRTCWRVWINTSPQVLMSHPTRFPRRKPE